MELEVGQYIALTNSIKEYFLKSDYTEKQVNSVIQIEDIYSRFNCVKLKGFVSPVKYEEITQLRFVDTSMTASYNVAMNTYYTKLCEHTSELQNLIPLYDYSFIYDDACKINKLVKTLSKETDKELNYELSFNQCCTALVYFIKDKLKN